MWSVFFLFMSYVDRAFVKGEVSSGLSVDSGKQSDVVFQALGDTLCMKSYTIGEFTLHQLSDGVEEIRSVHSPAGQLLQCTVTTNHTQVSSFMSDCRLGLRQHQGVPAQLKISSVAEAKANCQQLKAKDATRVSAHAQNASPGEGKLRRSKRGFTYPGTLWCGAGNIADDYEQLGEFTNTDKCCRTHDHCPHVIHAFSSNYGYTNFKWHSLSHCACDNALKECLRVVNDTSSRVVGQAFFNVIEVPCFELSFEEQCVERHWYGVCKRYDRVPVAVIKESIPYDFGGIEVIDELTLASPKKPSELEKDKQEKTQGSESTTQSSFSGSKSASPEEPSLTNVVTAAEDFIKVLATVSTSQSSSADNGKGEAQTSDKKRKKNAGKKKKDSKKRRGKGKGKKKKQNTDRVSKAEEGVAGAPSANRTEEVINKNHLVEEPVNFDRVNKKNDNFMTGVFDSVGDGEHSNKMMRDEHQRMPEESQISSTPAITPNAKQKEEMQKNQKQIKGTESAQVLSAVHITSIVPSKPRSIRLRQRAERKRQRYLTPTSRPLEAASHNRMGDNPAVSTSESTSLAGQTTHSPISPAREEAPRSSEYRGEKGSAFIAITQNTPIVGSKRQRSRHRGGRNRSKKLSTPSSPIEREVPFELMADATQELIADPSLEPPSVSERLQPDTPEILTRSTTGTPGKVSPTKNHQMLKDTRHKRRTKVLNFNPSSREDTKHENRVTTITSATTIPPSTSTDSPNYPHTKNAEATAGQLFHDIQTSAPSTLPLTTKTAKRRRSKERDHMKRRRNKVSET